MRGRTRERVQRILCAALLSSDLTESELRQIVDELSGPTAYDFTVDFGGLMRATVAQLQNHQPKQLPFPMHGTKTVEIAYESIQRRRLSKKEVLQLMTEVAGSDLVPADSDRPLRDILRRFFESASEGNIEKFIARLQPRDSDPYLQGIMGRR